MFHPRLLRISVAIIFFGVLDIASASGPRFHKDMSLLESRLEEFLENHKRPPLGLSHSRDVVITTDAAFLAELAHAGDANSEWMIEIFGEEKMGFDPQAGFDSASIARTTDGLALVDPWGRPYYVLIDYDGDGVLKEPLGLGNGTFEQVSFLIWSAGPDGEFGTPESNADNHYGYPGHVNDLETRFLRQIPLKLLLTIQLIACAAMTLIIWIVQLYIYPRFAWLYGEVFEVYHRRHLRRATLVIAPLMIIEAVACVACLWRGGPEQFLIPTILLALIWASTFFLQVPEHRKLTPETVPGLVAGNWIRTVSWTARTGLLISLF